MTPTDPPPRTSAGADSPGEPPPPSDPLDALRERIQSTQEAVERLAGEAARAAGAAGPGAVGGAGAGGRAEAGAAGERSRVRGEGAHRHPPRGYATAGGPAGDAERGARELAALAALFDVARGLVPRELAEQLAELVRELLLLARALIDWYLERLELRRRDPVEVEDIPIV